VGSAALMLKGNVVDFISLFTSVGIGMRTIINFINLEKYFVRSAAFGLLGSAF
jgi:hypothetical protein